MSQLISGRCPVARLQSRSENVNRLCPNSANDSGSKAMAYCAIGHISKVDLGKLPTFRPKYGRARREFGWSLSSAEHDG